MKILPYIQDAYRHRGLKRALLFGVNALRQPTLAREWFDYLANGMPPGMPEILRSNLVQKIFRPYLRRRFNARQRMEILRAHYSLFGAKFPPTALATLLQQPGMRLATLTGKSGQTYSVYLGNSTSKEGEADIFYMDDRADAPLTTLTGVFAPDGFYIGGLRGIKPPLGKTEIVHATRDLHGLRPKHAALHATCAIAEWFGATAIIAPEQRNHITFHSFGYLGFASREILADYNAFWEEFSSARRADGDYVLPTQLPRREAEDVKSKKRSEWLKRQGHLDEMTRQIVKTLNGSR